MNPNIKKPLAVITGGAGYLGTAIVKELFSRGWEMIILSRTKKPEDKFETYICDITNDEEMKNTIQTIIELHGEINACIHAAAVPLDRNTLLETSVESFTKNIDIALRGGFLLAQYATPYMKNGSTFIGVTTEASENSKTAAMGAYPLAKYALKGLLRFLSSELTTKGVRVYAVSPGFLPGGLNRDLPQPVMEFLKKKSEHLQTPEEVALLIADICEKDKEFPVGSSIRVKPREISPL